MDSDEHSEYTLRVGAAEWTRDPKDQEDDDDLYVEVSVDGTRQVLRTMYTKTSHWDEDINMIDIKSVVYNSSESLSIARVHTNLANLLETCADGDAAALELAIAPLVSATIAQVTVTDVGHGLKYLTPDSMGIITVKLSRPAHNPTSLPQLPNICAEPTPQMGDPEVITAVEVAPPPQGSNVGAENLVATKAVIDPNERSNFLLFVGAAEWTRDPGAQEDNYDLFVEVKVVGSREVHRTMYTRTARWDEDLKMIEIRSVAHNSSESLSVVRVDIGLQNLLEMCADGNRGFSSDPLFYERS
ncbi:hypothetical protein FIBSPDRAFT_902070 [Athelia psychrophila]|uniref:C2 domain-containing protein n=1 Tax=Athelia psychrophila TaxID=1759441 RepID=A0A167XPT5_9AGAM|nr:hypothetical protein FIBSPDRAFT_902070 [Fibularhizoctonia sp. CBS 109695]